MHIFTELGKGLFSKLWVGYRSPPGRVDTWGLPPLRLKRQEEGQGPDCYEERATFSQEGPSLLVRTTHEGSRGLLHWAPSLLLPSLPGDVPIDQTQPEALGRRTLCATVPCFISQDSESMAVARRPRKRRMLSTVTQGKPGEKLVL